MLSLFGCDQVQQLTYSAAGDLSEVAVELYQVRYSPTLDDDADQPTDDVSDAATFDERTSSRDGPPATAVPLHKAVLSPQSIRYSLTNRGGLSAKDGWLCWSAVDRVLCGRLTTSGRVVDVSTRLHHDAVAGTVCHGMGYWTTRGYANSRIGHLADWTTRGYQLCGHKITYRIIVFKYTHAETLINGLTTIANCILL